MNLRLVAGVLAALTPLLLRADSGADKFTFIAVSDPSAGTRLFFRSR